jgi:hypothetical protein
MRNTALIIIGALLATALVVHFVRGKKAPCERAFDNIADFSIELARGLGDKTSAKQLEKELEGKRGEFVAQCHQWPSEVVDCLAAFPNLPDSCEKILDETNLRKLHVDKIW